MTRLRLAAALACAVASLPGPRAQASPDPAGSFDYLYIEANSGSSAGGHAAVRFGDEVYHFQHAEPGIIRPAVQKWATFDLSYRGLGNRPIHVQRVAVSAATYEPLLSRFQRRFVVAESHVGQLEAVRRDRELLVCLSSPEREPPGSTRCGLKLQGAGYVDGPKPGSLERVARNRVVDDLRRRVERAYGPAYLNGRIDELRTQIAELRPALAPVDMPHAGRISASAHGIADGYAELLLEYLALRVLAGDESLAGDAARSVTASLSVHELEVLAARAAHQADRIVNLLASARGDRGYPLLIGLARLAALHASIERGELVVLDTYADETPTMPSATLRQYGAVVSELALERRHEMETMRVAALAAPADDEAAWSRFEVAANVALELEEALAGTRAELRWHQPAFGPAKGASLRAGWPVPKLPGSIAAAALEHTQQQANRIEGRLRELYRYDLIRRNCVTELFRTIDDDDPQTAFGDRIEVGANTNFIPFVSAMAVRDAYPVVEEIVLPSYRELALGRLRERTLSWTTAMREETSLTSTLIPFDPSAEIFLFFSDRGVAWRPFVGAANVAFAATAMLGGVVVAPFDSGSLLTAAARGLFYSLPEIAFVNIRKGSIALLPRDWERREQRARPDADMSGRAEIAPVETAPERMAPPQGERTNPSRTEVFAPLALRRPRLLSGRLEGRALGTKPPQ